MASASRAWRLLTPAVRARLLVRALLGRAQRVALRSQGGAAAAAAAAAEVAQAASQAQSGAGGASRSYETELDALLKLAAEDEEDEFLRVLGCAAATCADADAGRHRDLDAARAATGGAPGVSETLKAVTDALTAPGAREAVERALYEAEMVAAGADTERWFVAREKADAGGAGKRSAATAGLP